MTSCLAEQFGHCIEELIEPGDDEDHCAAGLRPALCYRAAAAAYRRASRGDLQVLLTEHALGVYVELGVFVDGLAGALLDLDGQPDLDAARFTSGIDFPVKRDLLDLADLDAGDLDRRAFVDVAGKQST